VKRASGFGAGARARVQWAMASHLMQEASAEGLAMAAEGYSPPLEMVHRS